MRRLFLVLCLAIVACSPSARQGSLPPIHIESGPASETSEQARIRATLPDGTEVYNLETIVVNDSGQSVSFPASATYRIVGSRLDVTSNGKAYTFPAASSVKRVPGGTYYRYRGTSLPVLLKDRTPNEVIHSSITSSTARTVECDDDVTYSANRSPQGVRTASGYCDSGLPFVTDQTAGAVSSFSADSCSFSANFDNPYGSATYTYSYTLYDANGRAVFSSPIINGGSLIGSQGGIWSDTSSYTYSRVQFIVTVYGGNNNAYTGNAHAHQP